MRKNFSLTVLLLISSQIFSQSPRQIVIEHFTNTKCSICASRNPGFYAVLVNYPQVIHIAYHPSAPYSQCYFSLQNPTENDGRTNFYNTYGSTPDYFLNGKQLPAANPAMNNTTLDTALNQFSPVEVIATEEVIGTDSVKVRLVVKTTGVTSLSTVKLFVAVAENPINYTGSNGESVHHDVFRKALTDIVGNLFALPALNDSVVYEFGYKVLGGWNINNLHTLALVQRTDTKEILNADNSERVSSPTFMDDLSTEEFSVYPNPVGEELIITNYKLVMEQPVQLFDLNGRKILEQALFNSTTTIQTSQLQPGIYFLKIGMVVKKLVKD